MLPPVTRPSLEQIFDLADDLERCTAATAMLLGRMPLSTRTIERLRRRYDDPRLPYHNAVHVGLLWLRHLAHGGDADDLGMALAILFHDAVYQPRRRDNEARSAALLRKAAGPREEVEWAAAALLATADHLGYAGSDPRVLRLLDLDLTPLAEPEPIFTRNTAALRQEAVSLTDAEWSAAQHRLLSGFAARSPLFRSGLGPFYEAAAQRNIASLLPRLDPGT